jgi:N-acetylmuramoyl-L-alanine amidase
VAPSGPYDLELEAAVRRFQRDRGLLESGLVDLTTWRAIVEAGYRLGDRLLYLRRPPLRGDDVAWLQNALGGR